jgi:hypothetical protein
LYPTKCVVHFAVNRCTRQPLLSTSSQITHATDNFKQVTVFAMLNKSGRPLGLQHLGSLSFSDTRFPELVLGQALVLGDVPYYGVQVVEMEDDSFLCYIEMVFSRNNNSTCTDSFPSFTAQNIFTSQSRIPPIHLCCRCMFWCEPELAHRAHFDGPTGSHCPVCHSLEVHSFVCDTCAKIEATLIDRVNITVPKQHGFALRNFLNSTLQQRISPRCFHNAISRNSYADEVFFLFTRDEIQRMSQFFVDFLLSGTWFRELTQFDHCQRQFEEVVDGKLDAWRAWTSMMLTNGHCPRLKVCLFLVRVALDIGPLVTCVKGTADNAERKRRKTNGQQREFYIDSFAYANTMSRNAWMKAIKSRLNNAKLMSQGTISTEQATKMGKRLQSLLQNEFWAVSLACTCHDVITPLGSATQLPRRCAGPSYDAATWKVAIDDVKHDNKSAEYLAWMRSGQEWLRVQQVA